MAEIAIALQASHSQLVQREKALIAECQRMIELAKQAGTWASWTWNNQLRTAKQRLKALEAGLLPIRIGGDSYRIAEFLQAGIAVPSQIVERAEEVPHRFAGAQPHVYGVNPNERTTLEQRRLRDPVLTMGYGGREFLLGFLVEIAMPDDAIPQFFGFIAPIVERGRGRPRLNQPLHPLLIAERGTIKNGRT